MPRQNLPRDELGGSGDVRRRGERGGEEQRPEVARLLEELTGKYAGTKYVRDNEKGLKALLNAFKPKEK